MFHVGYTGFSPGLVPFGKEKNRVGCSGLSKTQPLTNASVVSARNAATPFAIQSRVTRQSLSVNASISALAMRTAILRAQIGPLLAGSRRQIMRHGAFAVICSKSSAVPSVEQSSMTMISYRLESSVWSQSDRISSFNIDLRLYVGTITEASISEFCSLDIHTSRITTKSYERANCRR